MGVCSGDEGKPINLIFECGNRRDEVVTSDGRELRKPLKMFSKLSGIPESKIVDVQYKYKSLDLNSTIRELNIPSGSVLEVKLADNE
jgi:hypothetical protein